MKIRHLALVTLHADPATPSGTAGGGGTHAYVRELMAGLANSDFSLTVLTRWADPHLAPQEAISSKTRIIRLQIGDVCPVDKRLLNDLHPVSLSSVQAALKELPEADLMHSVYWNSGRVAMELNRRSGLPFVHTVISNGWRRWQEGVHDQSHARMEIEKQVFGAAFAIFCISRQERTDLIQHYEVDPCKIIVVGRPVASSFKHPSHDEQGRPSLSQWQVHS